MTMSLQASNIHMKKTRVGGEYQGDATLPASDLERYTIQTTATG